VRKLTIKSSTDLPLNGVNVSTALSLLMHKDDQTEARAAEEKRRSQTQGKFSRVSLTLIGE
jgi:hypothetical protein